MRSPVSIIVVYHSKPQFLEICLESILHSIMIEDEILVVVNNEDERIHNVNFYKNEVRYLHFYESLGYAKAANIGVDAAKNEYVIVCDHDLVFEKGWIDELWKLYTSRADHGAVSCKLLDPQTSRVMDFGIAFTEFCLSHPHMDLPRDHPLVSSDREVQMIGTGGFLVKKEHFWSVGGFNASFGSLYTDVDLCLRLKDLGLIVSSCASAVSYHFGGRVTHVERMYKAEELRTDVRAIFMKNNASRLKTDMQKFYSFSAEYFTEHFGKFKKYMVCNLMTVVDPLWYEEVIQNLGATYYDRIVRRVEYRDSLNIGLFEKLGYDIMAMNIPVAYFVDRFISLDRNIFWWENRKNNQDIVVDREGNILSINTVLNLNNR